MQILFIGTTELILIGGIALLLFGGKKLPEKMPAVSFCSISASMACSCLIVRLKRFPISIRLT